MRSRVLEPYVPEAATPSVLEAATICTRYFVSWWDTEDDARDNAEGAEVREEAKLPPQKRKQAYVEVLPQLLRRFSAPSATDGDKMLVCAMQLPRQADGPIVLHSEAARVFVRIQPSTATRQALASPGGQQCIDIILGHAGALKVQSAHPAPSLVPLAHEAAPMQPSAPRFALAVGLPPPMVGQLWKRWSARHPGRMLRKAVGLALFNEEESTHIKLSESKEMWLGTRQKGVAQLCVH